jgi:hypothetical protein
VNCTSCSAGSSCDEQAPAIVHNSGGLAAVEHAFPDEALHPTIMAACAQYSQATFNNTRARTDHVTTCVEISTSNNCARALMGMLGDRCCVETEACGTSAEENMERSAQQLNGLRCMRSRCPRTFSVVSFRLHTRMVHRRLSMEILTLAGTKVLRKVLAAQAE